MQSVFHTIDKVTPRLTGALISCAALAPVTGKRPPTAWPHHHWAVYTAISGYSHYQVMIHWSSIRLCNAMLLVGDPLGLSVQGRAGHVAPRNCCRLSAVQLIAGWP
jgi:hypothetical protein